MKKLSLFLALVTVISFAVSCGGSSEEASATVSEIASSEVSEISAENSVEASKESETEVSIVEKKIYEKAENVVRVYNVQDYGAKTNGTDASVAIQKAIDAASADGGGTVYLPAGKYTITKTIYHKAKVSIKGDGMWTTTLVWNGENDKEMINTANESLWGVTFENLYFVTSKSGIVGILGGSTLKCYNSAIGTFKNMVFFKLKTGILGNAEPEGVGIFDCLFENIFCSDCEEGLHLYGSGNTIIHPRISTCKAGLVLDYLNGESFDGVHVIGGVFAANTTDILIPSYNGTRPCDFVGTWFENASQGILTIAKSGTRVMNMTFRDCMLNSGADNSSYFLFNAKNAVGVVTLDSCTVVENKGIIEPSNASGRLIIKNLMVYDSTGNYVLSESDSGKISKVPKNNVIKVNHKLKCEPETVVVTPANAAAAKAVYYVNADETSITITFVEPVEETVQFYWEVRR